MAYDNIDFVSEALQKSQNQTLQLKYVASLEKEVSSSPFLEKAFVHLDRWEYVVIQEPHGVLVEKYFSSPAPRLKGMVLSTQMGFVAYGPRPPPLLFGGELADLDEFRAIRWKQMDWTDIHCHKLSVLEIEDYFSLDMETLFGVIAENLDLRILRIHFITFCEYNHSPLKSQPLVLRCLTDFTFTNIAEMVGEDRRQVRDIPVMRMLQRVQIPACTSFDIEIDLYNASDAVQKDFFRLIPSPIETFKRRGETQGFSSKPPAARITFWAGEFQCEGFRNAKSSLKYGLFLRNVPRSLGFEWIRKELVAEWTETRPDLQLRYWVDDDQYKIDDIFELGDLDHVVELEVMGSPLVGKPGVGSGLAKRLASPLTSHSGAVTGPFVRLSTLRLDHCAVTGKEMLSIVKDRFARITNPSSNLKGRKGAKKKKVDVRAEGGITVVLGKGMQRFSDSIARGIRSAPGVKDLRWRSDPPITDDDGSSSSEESDWYPRYADDFEDTSSEENTAEEWSDE
ncbi:hypothetical protein FRC05_002181 [Tulasnella sp. 425]|nr:hypothetical protein FRC05_002181 [Tulasnella sp. 425]